MSHRDESCHTDETEIETRMSYGVAMVSRID